MGDQQVLHGHRGEALEEGVELRQGRGQADPVSEPLQRRRGDARLVGVDLPRVEIGRRGPAEALQGREQAAVQGTWEQPEVASPADGPVAPEEREGGDRELDEAPSRSLWLSLAPFLPSFPPVQDRACAIYSLPYL